MNSLRTEWLQDKRIVLSVVVLITIASFFWFGSRYPDLGEKASMGGGVVLEDPLGFEALISIHPADPWIKRVIFTTINWVDTNKRGMFFGLLFAAILMTALPMVQHRMARGRFSSSLLGAAIGAPLGVCVNCAAPIARGMHDAGTKLETTLAAMISSPTLNIIILTMVFTLLPLHVAAVKLGVTLILILLAIPLMTRLLFPNDMDAGNFRNIANAMKSTPGADVSLPVGIISRWRPAIVWLTREYFRNLFRIVRLTVPFMLLAGFLGAIAITAVPWEQLAEWLPQSGHSMLLAMFGVALFGVFLPIPIALDVVICAALLAAGMPIGYVMVLLISLGTFSVYSYFIVGSAISYRVANALTMLVILASVAAGSALTWYDKHTAPERRGVLVRALQHTPDSLQATTSETVSSANTYSTLTTELESLRRKWMPVFSTGISSPEIYFQPMESPSGHGEHTLFDKQYGETWGIERIPDNITVAETYLATTNRPVAAGDLHNDGWQDFVLSNTNGLYIYANIGGKSFKRQSVKIPLATDEYVASLGLADTNDDGWLDIFISVFGKGNYILINREGDFLASDMITMPTSGALVVKSPAFGDLDRDGDLDIAFGNNTTTRGGFKITAPKESYNYLLYNENGEYRVETQQSEIPGETLSGLLSDINMDGMLDYMVGNDFNVPDYLYYGDVHGLIQKDRNSEVFPHTAHTTMSYDSADINNDLIPEIYIGQITGSQPGQLEQMLVVDETEMCHQEHTDPEYLEKCLIDAPIFKTVARARRGNDPLRCEHIQQPWEKANCVALTVLFGPAFDFRRDFDCDKYLHPFKTFNTLCKTWRKENIFPSRSEEFKTMQQIQNTNVLLSAQSDDTFADISEQLGIEIGGWTWNAKFADFDNDEWQDLYISNGFLPSKNRESNIFYHNRGGRHFIDRTVDAGLTNHLPSGSHAAVDIDNDGDLDIVTASFVGPVWVHKNKEERHHRLAIDLRDFRGNRFGIGSKVFIYYGDDGERKQYRELKASGGYQSFDPLVAYFGLGNHDRIQAIHVEWSTGERDEIEGEFLAGNYYRIVRPALESGTGSAN
ncbi:MAG: FG-GAP-like repeat-containing protein [Pseudomonadota bacterium]